MFTEEALKFLATNLKSHAPIESTDAESQLLALPPGASIASLENYQASPNRIHSSVTLKSCRSFNDYVNRFKSDSTSIYLDVDGGSFTAIIDHHDKDAPAWCSHRAKFAPKLSREWRTWKLVNGEKLSQLQLAHFIEENLDDIVTPEPNEMLAAALEFESNEKLAFGSAINLDDGSTKFTFQKDNAVKSVKFPHRITISIPLHENENCETLDARVRYRTNSDGVLVFTISLVRDPDKIVRYALNDIAEKIRAGTVDLHQYEGSL